MVYTEQQLHTLLECKRSCLVNQGVYFSRQLYFPLLFDDVVAELVQNDSIDVENDLVDSAEVFRVDLFPFVKGFFELGSVKLQLFNPSH